MTRSADRDNIKSIIPIYNEDRKVVIYAVNYEDGYVLVSATTKFYPILAQIDHGSFSIEQMKESGQNILIDEYVKQIDLLSKSDSIDYSIKSTWIPYIENDKPKLTRSYGYDDYYDAYYELVEMITPTDDETTFLLLKNCKGLIPDKIYNLFVNYVSDEDAWEGTEYSWENTAYVVIYDYLNPVKRGPYLTTTWSQEFPYWSDFDHTLGCVTVAVGQIMKYFQKPTDIYWNQMPNNDGSYYMDYFLNNLRKKLGIKDDGSGDNNKALEVLRDYGYNCNLYNHDVSKIISSTYYDNEPVYAYGYDKNNKKAHAWVIDGVCNTDQYKEYLVYRLWTPSYPKFVYDTEMDIQRAYVSYGYYLFHMNWGKGGVNDGWYLDTNIYTSEGNYSSERKEIIFN